MSNLAFRYKFVVKIGFVFIFQNLGRIFEVDEQTLHMA